MAKVWRPWARLGWSLLGGAVGVVLTPASAAAPRQVLPDTVVPVHYVVSIAPDAAALSFRGEVVADVDVRAPTRTITLNAVDLVLDDARLDDGGTLGIALDKAAETATLTAAAPIPAGRHRLGIRWHGPITRFTSGFFALDYQTPQGQPRRLLATKFEPAAARRFMPLWDEPAAKASFTLTATVPAADMAVSNTPVAREEPLDDGRKRVTFAATPRMSSYLLFFATGDLERVSRRVGNVDVGVIARRGAAERGRFALDAAAQLLPFYNRYFGVDYPLPKLDLIAGPGAGSFGAMENWGAIFFFEPVLLLDPATSGAAEQQRVYGVVAHEMAHQWFGDLVTMAWWDDLWLNEGFASWMAARATAEFHPEWQPWLASQVDRGDAMRLDALAGTHPVIQDVASGPAANQAFDGITYGKGQAVIRMLEATVGDEPFRQGVADYMRAHRYGNTVNTDLWQALGRVSPQPVEVIARDFLTQPGVPLVRVGADGRLTQGRLSYERDAPPSAWHIPLRVARVAADGTVGAPGTLLLAPDAGVGTDSGTGASAPRAGAPSLVNAGQSAYARVAYDATDFQGLMPAFPRLPPADQIGLLDDAWAIGQADAGAAPRTLALLGALPPDAGPLVWSQALMVLTAINRLEQGLPGEDRWQAWQRDLLAAPFARLGWDARPNEAANDAVLRQDLLLALGRADDPSVLAEARRRFAAWTADPARLDPALVQPVLALAGRQATPQDFAALRARARAERDPERQVLLYRAMAQVRDPALARRMLDLATSGEAPSARAADLVRTVARNHPDLAWRHALATLPELAPNLDLRQRYQYLPGVAAASSDAARADELHAIARRDFPPDARRFAEQAEAGIRQRAKVREQVLPALDGWLVRGR